jgi:hypothetical protein
MVVEITALYEVDENYRFFPASFNLHMGHRLFLNAFYHIKDTKDAY